MKVVVVGGGIAGLAVAHRVASLFGERRAEGDRVLLVEQEPLLASHASARNAAIFLPVEKDALSLTLALRQRTLLDALMGQTPWLTRTGALLVAADVASVAQLDAHARASGFSCRVLERSALRARMSVLDGDAAQAAVEVDDAGVLDIHAIVAQLARAARDAGAELVVGARVNDLVVHAGHVRAVRLDDGGELACDAVVLCGGAWSEQLGRLAGAPLPLVPLRRHLLLLDAGRARLDWPVVWTLGAGEVYFRPESGGVLASPCDEMVWSPGVPPRDPDSMHWLAERLLPFAPSLLSWPVRAGWACLRTFAPDRAPVLGRDPRVDGLFWHAGLGGQGMTVGLATAEIVANDVLGRGDVRLDRLGVGRLLG